MKKLLALLFALLAGAPAFGQTSLGPQVIQVRPPGSGGPTIDDLATYTLNSIPYSSGITATNTATARRAYNSHARNMITATFGDSVIMGVNETSSPYNQQYPNSVARQMATLLTASGVPASSQNVWGISGATITDYLNRSAWTTISGAAQLGTAAVQGGVGWNLTAVGAAVNFVIPGPVDTCQLYYLDGNNTRSIDYTIDGGSVTTINLTSTTQMARTAPLAMGSLANHTFSAAFGAASAGTVVVYGLDCWNSANIGINVWQFAGSGFQSANLLNDTSAPAAGRLQQLRNNPPDLAYLEMGPNDWRNSVTVATFKANMTQFVQFLLGLGTSVVLVTPPYDNGTAGFTADQNSYVAALYQISAEQGVGIIDPRRKWGNYANAVNNAWQYNPGFSATINITGATWSALTGKATYTVASTATMTSGTIVGITSVVSSGGTGQGYNAVGPITVVNGTTFTMQLGNNPGTYTSGGNAIGTDNIHLLYNGSTDLARLLSQATQTIIQGRF